MDQFTITAGQVTPEILSLFDIHQPTMPRAFNVLEGVTHGQILADDATAPTWGVVRDASYGTLYFGGQVHGSLMADLVQYFREVGEVGIGCWLDDPLNEIIPSGSDYDGRTLYFTERSPEKHPTGYSLPEGYRLVQRDEHLFSRSFDFQSTLDSFGSVAKVMEQTLGVVALQGDTLVCEAATGAPTHGLIEVGVTTAESYRGQGLATVACARLIERCEERGYRTWWDCAKQNTPSVKLARKLGYKNEREYRYVWWDKKR